MAALQHIARNHSGVLPRLFITGEFIALRIGNRFPPAHNDIETETYSAGRAFGRPRATQWWLGAVALYC